MTQPPVPPEKPPEIVAVLRWRDDEGKQLERYLRQGDLVIFGRDAETTASRSQACEFPAGML